MRLTATIFEWFLKMLADIEFFPRTVSYISSIFNIGITMACCRFMWKQNYT